MQNDYFSQFINRQGDFVSSENAARIINKLLSERETVESVLENIDEGIVIVQDTGKIVFANMKAVSLLGMSGDTRSIMQLDPEQTTDVFSLDALTFDYTVSKSVSFRNKELQVTISPFPEKKIIVYYIVDKTIFYKHYFSQYEHFNALNHIVSVLNHEIKTPLHTLSLDIELLQRKCGPQASSQVEAMQAQLDKITATLDTFVHSFRKLPFRFAPLHLPEVIGKALQILFYEMRKHEIAVEYTGEDIPVILGDENLLKEMFMHVVKNAVEAYDGPGTVRIESYVEDQYVVTTITDRGNGIAPENIARLFQPYFTTKPGATGLGLSLVSQIVYNHLGKIEITGRLGEGTTVRISLPMRTASQRSLPGAEGDIT